MKSRLFCTLLIVVASYQTANANSFGRTPGEYAVSSTGSARYSIPIWTPPGIRGIQPQIALTYDSDLSYGLMGPGWTLNGLSVIARCNRTFAQDSAPAPITLSATDAFCLDGNRLRLTSSEVLSTYGQAGTTYQTEIANFSNVSANGTAGNGPSYFTVQGKDGLMYEYGNTTDSRIFPSTSSTTPYIWALDKVTDRSGNEMTFTYFQAGGAYVPLSIQYTAPSGSTTFPYQVNFNYSTRAANDLTYKFVAGSQIQQTRQLSNITIKSSGTIVREYNLSYTISETTLRATLTSIQECGGSAGSDCYSTPTSIGYQSGSAGLPTPTMATGSGATNGTVYSVDIDGDGKKDLVFQTSSGLWWVQLATATGYGTPISTGASGSTILLDDFDGAGRNELLAPSGGFWSVYKLNGTSFTMTPTTVPVVTTSLYSVADIDGDGRPDLVQLTAPSGGTSTLSVQLNNSTTGSISFAGTPAISQPFFFSGISGIKMYGDNQSPNSPVSHFDFNGDGRSDLIIEGKQVSLGWIAWEYAYNGTSFVQTGGASLGTGSSPLPFVALNFNDDTCTDLMGSATLQISECNSNGFLDLNIPSGTAYLAVDWDGDGRSDILANVGGALTLYRSEGNAFAPGVPTGISIGSGTWVVTDQNGDGLDDLVFANGSVSNALYYGLHNGAGTRPDFANSFTDGYGNFVKPTYAPLTSSAVYLNRADATYPYENYIGPKYVVSQTTFSDPTNLPSGTYTQTMSYFFAWMNLQGRGFTGFNDIGNLDSRNGVWDVKFYRRDFPFSQMPLLDWVSQPNTAATFSLKMNNTFPTLAAVTLDSSANNQRYFPYVQTSTASYYELGGALNGDLTSTTVTTWTYDANGNATNISTSVTDNDPNSPNLNDVWTTTTATTYSPANTSTWCLNLPTEQDVTRAPPISLGSPAITRHITFTSNGSDSTLCRVTHRIVESGNSLYQLDTAFSYDGFGNVNGVTDTGIHVPAGVPAVRNTTVNWGTTGQFPTTIQNPLSQSITLGFDPNSGRLTSQTDPNYTLVNQLETSWTYDDFGRKQKEVRPDKTSTTWAYNSCGTGCLNSNNKSIVVQQNLKTDGSTLNTQNAYLDSLDRVLATSNQKLTDAYDLNEVQYDNVGNVHRQGTPSTLALGTTYWTTYTHDALNRLTSVQRPTSATVSTPLTALFTYQGRTTTATDPPTTADPSGRVTTKILLPSGLLAKTQDNNGYSVNFTYDAFGSLLTATDNSSPAITLQTAVYAYGINAFKVSATDADLGPWVWSYDSFGELTSYTDAKGQTTSLLYDALSRPTQRTEPDPLGVNFVTNWNWGSSAANFNIGKLQSVSATSAPGTYSEVYAYDSASRLSTDTISIPGDASYTYTSAYNSSGLLDTLQYPISTASYQLKLQYSYVNGILEHISDVTPGGPGTVYWSANTINPRGQILQETLGNGVIVNHTFDAVTSYVQNIQAGVGGGSALQNNSYLFDAVGNLTQRQDGNAGVTENAFPDSLYRLDHTLGDSSTQMSYDAMGRIATWEAYGATANVKDYVTPQAGCTYYPDHAQPHAVRKDTQGAHVGTFCYDANGNVTKTTYDGAASGTWTWTGFNKISEISGSASTNQFFYDANHQRYKQLASSGGVVENTIYVGGLLEKMSNSSGNAYRHYIPAGNNTIMYTRLSTGGNSTYYISKDHLGSSAVISDPTGASLVKEKFSALGWSENTAAENTTIAGITRHQFTGHEGINGIDLINMDGRLYYASGAMLLSPDPYVSDPGNTQSFNRYGYVNNNPLSLVDPSGYDPIDAITVVGELGGPENPWADVAAVAVEAAELFGFSNLFGIGGPSLTPNQRLAQSHGIDISSQIQRVPALQSFGNTVPLAAADGNNTLSEVVVAAHQWHVDPAFIQGFSNAVMDALISGPHANTGLSVSLTRPEVSPDHLETITVNGYFYPYSDDFLDVVPGWALIRCAVLSNCGGGHWAMAAIAAYPGGSAESTALEGTVKVTREGLEKITSHLAQFGDHPPNQAMIDRLSSQIGSHVTGADANFYNHELIEAQHMASGLSYDAAHSAALEQAGVSPFSLYHPEVIQQFPEYFNNAWLAHWGIP